MIYHNVKIRFKKDSKCYFDVGSANMPAVVFSQYSEYEVKVLIETETHVNLQLQDGHWFYRLEVNCYDLI